jgi:hypothetical protein
VNSSAQDGISCQKIPENLGVYSKHGAIFLFENTQYRRDQNSYGYGSQEHEKHQGKRRIHDCVSTENPYQRAAK